jgi:1-deoxy-D-xylulose-5-phosphate reductoisomerase
MKNLTILGATGSIGRNTLDVAGRHPDRFRILALSAHSQIEALVDLCLAHQAQVAVVPEAQAAQRAEQYLREQAPKATLTILHGAQALCDIAASPQTDCVMAAIVGAAGLPAVMAAAQAGKQIFLANKEALVMSGHLLMQAVQQHQAQLLPVDSEHNAIFQCLPQDSSARPLMNGVRRLILTASGGPFRQRDMGSLQEVTPEQACAHPNWVMGRKISVDSATMMNKGLEVIEARWLFDIPAEKIEVVIHPQSVIHSMVEYEDGSVLAQLGQPDMRTPIAHALAWPERVASGVTPLNLLSAGPLEFSAPDLNRFPCLGFAYQALKQGHDASIWLNAANEIAVQSFLEHKIRYLEIPRLLQSVLERSPGNSAPDIETVIAMDQQARRVARDIIQDWNQ